MLHFHKRIALSFWFIAVGHLTAPLLFLNLKVV